MVDYCISEWHRSGHSSGTEIILYCITHIRNRVANAFPLHPRSKPGRVGTEHIIEYRREWVLFCVPDALRNILNNVRYIYMVLPLLLEFSTSLSDAIFIQKPLMQMKKQSRKFYDYKVIKNTLDRYRKLFNYYKNTLQPERNGDYIDIPYPKMSPIIAESLTRLVIYKDLIQHIKFDEVRFSESGGDLIGIDRNKRTKTIEVKSTGANAFQNLSKKDLEADFVIWVHFGSYCHGDTECIRFYVINVTEKEWGNLLTTTNKLVLNKLLPKLVRGKHYEVYEIELKEGSFFLKTTNSN